MENKLVLFCECNCEALVITKDEYVNQEFPTFDLAFYSQGIYKEKTSILDRFKFCWKYLKTGKLYNDYLILNKEEAKRLNDYLTENLK